MKQKILALLAAFSVAKALWANPSSEYKVLVLKTRNGLAIQGYDPVAYFTDNKALKGNPKFSSEYEGGRYLFASAEHKSLFDSNPAKYAPAYGGYCGYAASIGKVRPADPLLWSIVHGQLIVQHTKGAADLWNKDVATNKAKADKNWPLLEEKKAGLKNPIDSLLGKSVLANAN